MPETEKNEALLVLGKNMRRLREVQKVSQEALAFNAGLDRAYVGGAERGERNITILSALKISKALECELTDLVEGVR